MPESCFISSRKHSKIKHQFNDQQEIENLRLTDTGTYGRIKIIPDDAKNLPVQYDKTRNRNLQDECLYNLTKLAEITLVYFNNQHPVQKKCSPHKDNDHRCWDCGKSYSTSSNLARHRQIHRSIADKKAKRCEHCGKVYVSIPAYTMHMRTHTQSCKCDICGKRFSRPWLLQGHIRTHTGEKPFKCVVCDKAFADKSNLRAHVQTHSSHKPYTCQHCGKTFSLKSYLCKHEESSCINFMYTDKKRGIEPM